MMDNPILFIDSGIGGIPYCGHFQQRNPGVGIVYLADRLHFPYGKWEKTELAEILKKLTARLVNVINPKIVVLACNTATIAALAELRECFPDLPFVGTVPAIKPAALASKTGKIGVLGTELTIKQPYIRELASKFGNCEIHGIAAPELVEFVEGRLNSASVDEKRNIVTSYLNRFRAEGVDTLVLGCTHFLLLLDEFQREAVPDITVFDSITGISHRIESLLAEQKEKNGGETPCPQNRILLTGPSAPEPSWVSLARRLGFSLSLLDSLSDVD
jgi:glutamate racemase